MYTHPNSKLKGLSKTDRQLAIEQAIADYRRLNFNGQDTPQYVSACVAHGLICAHDDKVWNSVHGPEAYCEVLAVTMAKFATAKWIEVTL